MRAAKHWPSKPSGATAPLSASWEKAKTISVIVSSLALPVVIAVLGNSWTQAAKQQELGARYVELAIGILKAAPTNDTRTMRLWSISILDHFSPVAIPLSAKSELELGRLIDSQQAAQQQMQSYSKFVQEQQIQYMKENNLHPTGKDESPSVGFIGKVYGPAPAK